MSWDGARIFAIFASISALLGGGCAPQKPAELPPPAKVSPPPPALPKPTSPLFQRSSLGKSVLGREISMYTLHGHGPAVLIIGGIHGNEQTSVDVAEGLLELLRTSPQLAGSRRVSIIPNSNPDGYLAGTRHNSRKIDINRNFPATNFKPQKAGVFRGGGVSPLSEPESAAIERAIESTRPRLIISIHSIDRGRECNNWDGPGETYARIMSQHNGYPAVATIGYPTPGSLGSFAGIDKQYPMVTLELPRTLPGADAWKQNRDAILAAINAVK